MLISYETNKTVTVRLGAINGSVGGEVKGKRFSSTTPVIFFKGRCRSNLRDNSASQTHTIIAFATRGMKTTFTAVPGLTSEYDDNRSTINGRARFYYKNYLTASGRDYGKLFTVDVVHLVHYNT